MDRNLEGEEEGRKEGRKEGRGSSLRYPVLKGPISLGNPGTEEASLQRLWPRLSFIISHGVLTWNQKLSSMHPISTSISSKINRKGTMILSQNFAGLLCIE